MRFYFSTNLKSLTKAECRFPLSLDASRVKFLLAKLHSHLISTFYPIFLFIIFITVSAVSVPQTAMAVYDRDYLPNSIKVESDRTTSLTTTIEDYECTTQKSEKLIVSTETSASGQNEATNSPSFIPNDTYFPRQWAFKKIQALPVESCSTEIIVAVLDTGIDQQHEDLKGKVIDSINFTKSRTVSDLLGHGTHIAGIISANTDNGIGIAGIAPNARLLNVKAAEDSGLIWPSSMADGIKWAVDNGASIINISSWVPASSSALDEAVDYAWSKGVLIVAAAGNRLKSVPVYPSCYPNVIGVAATDIDDNLWTESNYGNWINVCAPGVDIFSTLPSNRYDYQSGTSMATACVSAIAALAFNTVTDDNSNGFLNDEVLALLNNLLPVSN